MLLVLSLLATASPTLAGVHYIRPGGTGNGSSWATAYSDLPATFVRGDTYYVASGSYGPHAFASLPGTNFVYIKKATQAVNGSDPGWDPSYDSGEALFSASGTVWTVNMAYLDVDGVYGTFTNQHGIHLSSASTVDTVGALVVPSGPSTPQSHVWFRHVEMNNGPWNTTNSSRVVFHNSPNTTDWNFQYCYMHHAGLALTFIAGAPYNSDHLLLEYCVFKDTGTTGANHCAVVAFAGCNYTTIRYNVFWNPHGFGNTTYIEPQFYGTGCYVYGNVFVEDNDPNLNTGYGLLGITSTDVWTDVRVYNNTAYNLHISFCGLFAGHSAGSQVYAYNNVFQNCSGPVTFQTDVAANLIEGTNIFNTGEVTFRNAANGDFHLAAPTRAGTTFAAPYNVDPDGNIRGVGGVWSLGAYQYTSGPTTNAAIAVSPASLNFGALLTNTTSQLSFTVQNVGGGTLTGSAGVSAPFSIVSGGSYTLGAGQSQAVTVGYGQSVVATNTGTATFTGGGGAVAAVTGSTRALWSTTVTPANSTLVAGASQQFAARGTYSDGATQDLTTLATWSSATPAVATIGAHGLATGVAAGTSTISASYVGVKGSTILTVQTAPLAITTTALPSGSPNTPYSAALSAFGGTGPYSWALTAGSLPTGLSLAAGTGIISGTPTAAETANFTIRVTDSAIPVHTTTAALSLLVSPVVTIWPGNSAPTVADQGGDSPVELGVKFSSDVAGTINGIRFYKSSANLGVHVGNLWSSNGTQLATATLANETASGWQQVLFAPPVAITSNTTYVASYFVPAGHYSADANYFATNGVDMPPLHALSDGAASGNGVYAYGSSSSFPNQTWSGVNYWVDVLFQPATATSSPPSPPKNLHVVTAGP